MSAIAGVLVRVVCGYCRGGTITLTDGSGECPECRGSHEVTRALAPGEMERLLREAVEAVAVEVKSEDEHHRRQAFRVVMFGEGEPPFERLKGVPVTTMLAALGVAP